MSTFESTLSLADHYHKHGFAVLEKCLSTETVARFVELTELARENCGSESAVANSAGVYALRNLTEVVPETTELVRNPAVQEIVEAILGPNAFLIRSTLFDKTDGANWGVFWHQDLSIAVEQRNDVAGFHASSPMERSGHRRVIHFEFAAFELPSPLKWRFRIPCA